MDRSKKPFKPELLLPVGNTEAFHAALEGGADAIYLGLNDFNARKRANNFTPWQVAGIVGIARIKKVKVYITLNTVIRNNELEKLIDTLYILSQIKPDGVIIQDWGVYWLAKKFFPQLMLHASTQMANHNTVGITYASKMGFHRVVLPRELTQTEIESIASQKQTELELFIHGALCYSFSGMCLFSSYLGGASANRGACTQPCRRIYKVEKEHSYLFSLKDNQLAEHLPFLKKNGIDSLKVEGRLKSAEYVYQVARQYRKTIEQSLVNDEIAPALRLDFGREKTDYFVGKNVAKAITQSANTGLYVGSVISINNNSVVFTSETALQQGYRLRFRNKETDRQTDLKINQLKKQTDQYEIQSQGEKVELNDEVYLIGLGLKFSSKIDTQGIKINDRYPAQKVKAIKSLLGNRTQSNSSAKTYLRIDNLEWLQHLNPKQFQGIIIQLSKNELTQFNPKLPIIQSIKNLVWMELPKFISEGSLDFYRQEIKRLHKDGISNFSISHLSQKELLPKGSRFITNENVYVFNDAAAKALKDEGVFNMIYPYENDIVNLSRSSFRNGLVPIYYYPTLFYSRMPIMGSNGQSFSDQQGNKYRKIVRDGMTIVIPENAVSLGRFKQKLDRYGFSNYLIDLSYVEPNKKTIETIVQKFRASEGLQPSNIFNFKRELK